MGFGHSHDHTHGVDDAMRDSAAGIRAVKISLVVLGITALAQWEPIGGGHHDQHTWRTRRINRRVHRGPIRRGGRTRSRALESRRRQ